MQRVEEERPGTALRIDDADRVPTAGA